MSATRFGGAAVLGALVPLAAAKKVFEANAYVTPKTENFKNEPYLDSYALRLATSEGEDVFESENGADDPAGHIVTTSDIDNYFNLQITTKLYFGSH